MTGWAVIGSFTVGNSYSQSSIVNRDSNAMFMTDENEDEPTKITANTSDSNALFME